MTNLFILDIHIKKQLGATKHKLGIKLSKFVCSEHTETDKLSANQLQSLKTYL